MGLELKESMSVYYFVKTLQILNCPRLMQVVFEQYLPLAWSGNREGAEEGAEPSQVGMGPSGWPQVEAVNLVRAMCVAGRNIASQLVHVENREASINRDFKPSRFPNTVFSLSSRATPFCTPLS